MKVTNRHKILLLLPFLIISIIAFYRIDVKSLEVYNTSFISIALTIATFSISFAFLQYQFSPYKALLKSISKRQLLFSYIAITIALLPLFALFINSHSVPKISLFAIPILAYFSILLLLIAIEESNPAFLLNRITNKKRYKSFLTNFKTEFESFVEIQSTLNFSRPDEQPMHDFGEANFQITHLKNDPFIFINNALEISINNADIETFEKFIQVFFKLLKETSQYEIYKTSEVRFRLRNHLNTSFSRIAYSTSKLTENKIYHNRFLDITGTYLKQEALIQQQVNDVNQKIISSLTQFAVSILKTNSDSALYITSLFRQLAQKGIYDNAGKKDTNMFNHYLSTFPLQIKVIGQEAIKIKDSDFLFRCLEELGFLGCTSIKQNHYQVGIECLQSLVQLGREARSNELQCFWRHCMLEAIDHAEQRIWWMLSWVPQLDDKSVDSWIESFETAYSRLNGFKKKISKMTRDDRKGFEFVNSKEPYIEYYSEEHYSRAIDYSDFKQTKEFKLH